MCSSQPGALFPPSRLSQSYREQYQSFLRWVATRSNSASSRALIDPGDNLTGVAFLVNGLATKQVELLHQLVPKAAVIGFLVNPKDPNAEGDIKDAQAAANAFGLKLVVGKAGTEDEINSTFRNVWRAKSFSAICRRRAFSPGST